MKYVLTILPFLILLSACSHFAEHNNRAAFEQKLIVGEWELDSSSLGSFARHRLIVTEDSTVYLFSGGDGGSLVTKGKTFGDDSITTDHHSDWGFLLTDSNHLQLSGRENKIDFYKRRRFGQLHANLTQYLQSDSLRTRLIGWWKLVAGARPITLPNYYGYFQDLTLQIRSDGVAVFFLENSLDSTAEYFYSVNPDGISLNRGCVITYLQISLDATGRMQMIIDKRMGNTLLLQRLRKVQDLEKHLTTP